MRRQPDGALKQFEEDEPEDTDDDWGTEWKGTPSTAAASQPEVPAAGTQPTPSSSKAE